jgi:hypothetical protein
MWILKRLNNLFNGEKNMDHYLLLLGSLFNRFQAFQDHKKI